MSTTMPYSPNQISTASLSPPSCFSDHPQAVITSTCPLCKGRPQGYSLCMHSQSRGIMTVEIADSRIVIADPTARHAVLKASYRRTATSAYVIEMRFEWKFRLCKHDWSPTTWAPSVRRNRSVAKLARSSSRHRWRRILANIRYPGILTLSLNWLFTTLVQPSSKHCYLKSRSKTSCWWRNYEYTNLTK